MIDTPLPGVFLIEGQAFSDERGLFRELYHGSHGSMPLGGVRFVQDNYSFSKKGVLRGLHFQEPNGQGKLVQVVRGAIFDVAVDVRRGSPYFGKWFGMILSSDNYLKMWISPGFAHGFYALSDADVVYKCTEGHVAKHERAIRYDDRAIGIDWPSGNRIISQRDESASLLTDSQVLPRFSGDTILNANTPLERYVRLLDKLFRQRGLGALDDESEERFAVDLNDCRQEMSPEDEARIPGIIAGRKSEED